MYSLSHTFLLPKASLPPLRFTFRRNIEESSAGRVLLVAVKTLQSVKPEVQEGYRALVHDRLAEARENFKSVPRSLLLVSSASDTEAKEVSDCE